MVDRVTEKRGHPEMWLVGENMTTVDSWWMVGIFSTEELAVANVTSPTQFVSPITPDLDVTGKPGPDQIDENWDRSYCPLA